MLERITRRSVFRGFAPPAPRYRSRLVTLVVAPRAQSAGDGAGLAMAVGRGVGPAVVRNRIRRQIRHVAVELDSEQTWPSGWYLVIAHRSARGCTSADLRSALVDVLARAGARS